RVAVGPARAGADQLLDRVHEYRGCRHLHAVRPDEELGEAPGGLLALPVATGDDVTEPANALVERLRDLHQSAADLPQVAEMKNSPLRGGELRDRDRVHRATDDP